MYHVIAEMRHPTWLPEVYASRLPLPLKTPAVVVGNELLVVVGLLLVVEVEVGGGVEEEVDEVELEVGEVEPPDVANPN